MSIKLEHLDDPIKYIEKYLRVLTKADAHGISQLVPMTLWPAQKYYLEHRTHRDIILKARQMGLSTGVMAGNAYRSFTFPYSKMAIITHNQETSEFLLQTVHRFWRNLPENMRPRTDWRSSSRIRFPDLDSVIIIDSAESKSIGVGQTLNIAHLSEMSRWPVKNADDLFSGISQTVPFGGYITIESTPKGRVGKFYEIYTAAKAKEIDYTPFFFPWWFDERYKLSVSEPLKLSNEEKVLMESYKLTQEQIQFRRSKISELGDLFFQEYPENDIDCWLSNEQSVFDGIALRWYLQQLLPGKQEGNLTIWHDVLGGEQYVIGVDPAGGSAKGDYSVACVLNVRRNEYVARLRGRIAPDLFAQEVIQLGRRYNMAQIGVERAQHGHMILKVLLDAGYPELYRYRDYDVITGIPMEMPGWRTNLKTKPIMVNTLAAQIRARVITIWSENLLLEASAYVWDGDKTKPSAGGFDDELDALMITLQMREESPIAIQELRRVKPVSYATI